MIIEWTKDCTRNAPATKPGFVYKAMSLYGKTIYRVEVSFYPGPVCDGCGKRWKLTKAIQPHFAV